MMANAKAPRKTMTRGNSRRLYGVISPGKGGALSLPITAAVFEAVSDGQSITKTLGAGITITGATTAGAPYTIDIAAEDTASFPGKSVSLTYTLTITETGSPPQVSTVVGGILVVTPN